MGKQIKLKVNIFKSSGKWYEGHILEIDESVKLWDDEFKRQIVRQCTLKGINPDFTWVITHLDEYENDPTAQYFYQCMISGKDLQKYL